MSTFHTKFLRWGNLELVGCGEGNLLEHRIALLRPSVMRDLALHCWLEACGAVNVNSNSQPPREHLAVALRDLASHKAKALMRIVTHRWRRCCDELSEPATGDIMRERIVSSRLRAPEHARLHCLLETP